MALDLYIPPCICTPAHVFHPPPLDRPLRIQVDGPLTCIQKLLPAVSWDLERLPTPFPQPAGPLLARLAFQAIHGQNVTPESLDNLVVRNEYTRWVVEVRPRNEIDYYGVTFDHLVPPNDTNPEVLQINIIETDGDGGEFANKHLSFSVDPADYTGKRVLAVPRCCQKRKGTTDRARVNEDLIRAELIRSEENDYWDRLNNIPV